MTKEIIFSDIYGRELFRIPDDSCINVTSFDGQRTTYPCKYVSAAETNIGGCIYEAGVFAQEQAEKGAVFAPSDKLPEDIGMYEIHQIRNTRQTDYAFRSFEEARNAFQPLDYTRAYTGMLAPGQSLEHLFALHNADERPFGRKMRSLSVSDVVVILKDGAATAHYVDSFGFAPAPRFLEPDTLPTSQRHTVSGYTITVSIPIGNKAFVLAENPHAVQPFVTWQSSRDNKSCEWGHYYGRRTDAVRDLYRRVNQERDFQRDFPMKKKDLER
jgi:hypothetical protein